MSVIGQIVSVIIGTFIGRMIYDIYEARKNHKEAETTCKYDALEIGEESGERQIFYLCDGEVKNCNKRNCYYKGHEMCRHTTDIKHAKNFKRVKEKFFERGYICATDCIKQKRLHDKRF